MNTKIKNSLNQIELQLEDFNRQRYEAVTNKQWSQAAGFDDIAKGLMLAAEIINNELKDDIKNVQKIKLDPVEGDLLPSVGSVVSIHLNRPDKWVNHTVVGYYVWGDLKKNPSLSRVFVRVVDDQGCMNARLLSDVKPAI